VLKKKAYVYENGKKEVDIPQELLDKVEELRVTIIEDIVESDDSLMEKYLEGQEIEAEEVLQAPRALWFGGKGYRSGHSS